MNIRNYIEKVWPFFMTKEDRFYYHLFVKNGQWNTATPNKDEGLRWNAIEGFLTYVQTQMSAAPAILDVGSGRGWSTNLLTAYGKAEGLEPVASVVKHATKLFPSIVFHHGTVEQFAKKGRRFGLVVCTEVIEHVPDNEKPTFIRALHSMLDDHGFLIVTTPRKELFDQLPLQPGQPVEAWLSESDLLSVFTANAFKAIDKKLVRMDHMGETYDVYQAWLFQRLQ